MINFKNEPRLVFDVDGELLVTWYELDPGKPYPWIKHVISAGENIGAGADLDLADMDGDGDLDLVATGKNGGPWLFENLAKNPLSVFRPGLPAPGKRRIAFDGDKLLILDRNRGRERARDIRGKELWSGSNHAGAAPKPERSK